MLPVKLMEYAHLGIPAVVPRLPVIEHYFADDAVSYYDPDNVAGMAAALARVLSDAELRARLRERAGAVVRRIGWGQAKRDLFAVIDG
jgi:glycosyltransferase involved in cell wall biosynthesis